MSEDVSLISMESSSKIASADIESSLYKVSSEKLLPEPIGSYEDSKVHLINKILQKLFLTNSILRLVSLKDPEIEMMIRDLMQEWVHEIGYPKYDESFVSKLINIKIDIFNDPMKMSSVENLLSILSEYKSDPEQFLNKEVINYIKEEAEELGIKDLVPWDDKYNYVRYIAYILYIIVINNLSL